MAPIARDSSDTLFFRIGVSLACTNWQTREGARRAIFRYIETWYNRKRRHSTLGYLSPAAYEEQLQAAA